MKKVLCFGDSNTYGYIPSTHERYDKNVRWTGVLQKLCGSGVKIIEAGCNNRTAFCDNSVGIMQTGAKIFPIFLSPDLDYIIIALGINDMQMCYEFEEIDIKNGVENLINMAHNVAPCAEILLVCPCVLTKNVLLSPIFSQMFNQNSIDKSHKLPKIYSLVAKEKNCKYLDLNAITQVSQLDGLHYEAHQHKIIAEKIYELLMK